MSVGCKTRQKQDKKVLNCVKTEKVFENSTAVATEELKLVSELKKTHLGKAIGKKKRLKVNEMQYQKETSTGNTWYRRARRWDDTCYRTGTRPEDGVTQEIQSELGNQIRTKQEAFATDGACALDREIPDSN